MKKQLTKQVVTADVDVNVTYDTNGNPLTATGQKELDDTTAGENPVEDGTVKNLAISDTAKAVYSAALAAAKAAYDNAVAAAQSVLSDQILSDNYVNGAYTPPATSCLILSADQNGTNGNGRLLGNVTNGYGTAKIYEDGVQVDTVDGSVSVANFTNQLLTDAPYVQPGHVYQISVQDINGVEVKSPEFTY